MNKFAKIKNRPGRRKHETISCLVRGVSSPNQNHKTPLKTPKSHPGEGERIFRRGVSMLITNNRNEFLIINLQSFEDRFFAIPGGGIEKNESLIDAAYREIQEELGIRKSFLEFVGECKKPNKFTFKVKKLNRDGIIYDGQERYFLGFKFTGSDREIKLQPEEVRKYKWVTCKNLKNYLLFDNQLQSTLEKLLELFPNAYNKKQN